MSIETNSFILLQYKDLKAHEFFLARSAYFKYRPEHLSHDFNHNEPLNSTASFNFSETPEGYEFWISIGKGKSIFESLNILPYDFDFDNHWADYYRIVKEKDLKSIDGISFKDYLSLEGRLNIIKEAIKQGTGYSFEDYCTNHKTSRIPKALKLSKYLFFYFASKYTSISQADIMAIFEGKNDRSMIAYALKQINKQNEANGKTANVINMVDKQIMLQTEYLKGFMPRTNSPLNKTIRKVLQYLEYVNNSEQSIIFLGYSKNDTIELLKNMGINRPEEKLKYIKNRLIR